MLKKMLVLAILVAQILYGQIQILKSSETEVPDYFESSDYGYVTGSDLMVKYTNPFTGTPHDSLYVLYIETYTQINRSFQWSLLDTLDADKDMSLNPPNPYYAANNSYNVANLPLSDNNRLLYGTITPLVSQQFNKVALSATQSNSAVDKSYFYLNLHSHLSNNASFGAKYNPSASNSFIYYHSNDPVDPYNQFFPLSDLDEADRASYISRIHVANKPGGTPYVQSNSFSIDDSAPVGTNIGHVKFYTPPISYTDSIWTVLSGDTSKITLQKTNATSKGSLIIKSGLNFATDSLFTFILRISARGSDGTWRHNIDSVKVHVNQTSFNTPPVLAGAGSTTSFVEYGGAVIIAGNITVTDADTPDLTSASITISSNYKPAEDLLAFTNGNGITGSWNSTSGKLTLSGVSSVANYENALRSITFSNSSENPTTTPRTIAFIVNDGFANSNQITQGISITAVNSSPVLSNAGVSFSYSENNSPMPVSSTIRLYDADSLVITGATISITGNYISSEDILSYVPSGGITPSWNSSTGVLTLSGTATVNFYQGALRAVYYRNTSENPNTLNRSITFQVYDGSAYSNLLTKNGLITSVNDTPVIMANTVLTVNQNNSGVIENTNLRVSDVDNTAAQLIYSLSSVPSNGLLRNNTTVLAANETFSQTDIDAGLINYTHDGSAILSDAFIFTVSDGAGGSIGSTTFNITITDNIQPTVALSSLAPNPTNAAIPVTITFSEDVSNFEVGDLIVSNGTAGALTVVTANRVWSTTITPTADGLVTVNLPANSANDAALNNNTTATQLSRTYDGTAPTVTLSTTATNPTNAAIPVTITFSEDVSNFEVGDLVVANGTAGALTVVTANRVWSTTITPTADGLVTVNLPANSANDAALNNNTAATQLSINYDGTAPTVTLSTTATNPTNAAIPVTITFSEDVSNFEVGDLVVANGTAGALTVVTANRVWSTTITPTADGLVTVNLPANSANDAALNNNTVATQLSRTYDGTAPSVTLSTTATNPTNAAIPVTITFSEDVSGFEVGDLVVANGTAGALTVVTANRVWSTTITPTADGLVTVNLPANSANDAALNNNTAATQLSRTYDGTAPTVTLSTTATNPTNAAIPVTITFSEDVSGFEVGDLVVTNGTAGALTVVTANRVWSTTITPTADGVVTVNLPANSANDAALNNNTAATQLSRNYDSTAPSVTLSTTATNPTNAAIPVTITFSEDVSNFVVGDLVVANGTAGALTVVTANRVWSTTITPTADGLVTVNLPANSANDAALNNNTAATQLSRTFDGTAPTVTLSTTATNPTNAAIPVTITFSEDVSNFEVGDLIVTNGTSGALTVVIANRVWSTTITPTADGLVTVNLPANSANDAALNNNTAATQLSRTYDGTAPTVTLSTTATNPTNAAIPVTITFSEDVSGFEVGDLVVTNGTAGALTVVTANKVWSTTITPTADGVVTVNLPANSANDAALNNNTAATQLSRTYDGTAPTVTLSTTATNPTNAPIPVTITFSEDVSGFEVGDLVVANGTAGALTVVTANRVWSTTITPTADGLVTVNLPANSANDAALNNNTAASQLSRTYDGTAPTVTLSTTATNPTNAAIPVTITFSEDVSNFEVGDLVVANGTAGVLTVVTANRVWSTTITPTADGLVTVNLPANSATDAALNNNTAATQLSRTYDGTAPTVTLSTTATNPTNAAIPVTITFSEDVSNFEVGDLVVTNGTAGALTVVTANRVWSTTITPTADGLVTVNLPANSANDAALNNNTAATQLSRTFDGTAPTVTLSTTVGSPTNLSPFQITISFSESVSNFTASDISVINGTAANLNSADNITFTANISAVAAGPVSIQVNAGVANDAASNNNTISNSLNIIYDATNPTPTISSAISNPTNLATIPVTVNFDKAVTGFAVSDLTIINGSAANFTIVDNMHCTFNLIPAGQGNVSVDIAAGTLQDLAGNPNNQAAQFLIIYDSVKPIVTLTTTVANPANAPFAVTVEFNEEVSGFEIGDLIITNGTAGALSVLTANRIWTTTITPAADGLVTINLPANIANDGAVNSNIAATELSLNYDATLPAVTLTSSATNPTNAPFTVTIAFSEVVSGFEVGDLIVTNGTAGVLTVVTANRVWSTTITPTTDGLVTVNLPANSANDTALNNNTAATELSRDYDATLPTVTLTSLAVNPTNAPFTVTVAFSEVVSGFDVGDLIVTNGTAGALSTVNANRVWTTLITPVADGLVTVNLPANAATDAAGNGNSSAAQYSITYDATNPVPTVSSVAVSPTNTAPIPFTVTFTKAVTGFTIGDLNIGNGTAANFSELDGSHYAFEVTPLGQGNVTVDIPVNSAFDPAGNGNTASIQYAILFDSEKPTALLTSTATNPTNLPVALTITFNEPVSGLTLSDLLIGNGTASNLTNVTLDQIWTVTITPVANGLITVDLPANAVVDAAGNSSNATAQYSTTYDAANPIPTISSATLSPTNQNPIPVTISFDKSVSGFEVTDLVIFNGTAADFATIDNSHYSFNLIPAGQGNITVDLPANSVVDGAGNNNIAAAQFSIVYDSVIPTVTLTSSAANPINTPFTINITFSESISGFSLTDLLTANGTAGDLTEVTPGVAWTALITPAADGLVTIDLPVNAASDAAGNNNSAALPLSINYDGTAPTVVVSTTASNPTNISPIPLTISFSEAVNDFLISDLVITNATAANFTTADNIIFTADIIPVAAGEVSVTLNQGAAQDLAGNGSNAANLLNIVYDALNPTPTIASTATNPTNLSPIPVTVTFDKAVAGFEINDLTIANGTAANFITVDASHYTFDLIPDSQGNISIDISAGAAADLAANPSNAAAQFNINYDSVQPSVILSAAVSLTNLSPITATIVFSEIVSGFEIGDLAITNGTAANLQNLVTNQIWAVDITPVTEGSVTVNLPVNSALDAAGNSNTAANQLVVLYDITAPSMTFVPANNSTDFPVANNLSITFSDSVRLIDNTALDNASASALITLKKDNAAGENVAFSGTIDAAKKVITIDPASDLINGQNYYFALAPGVEDFADNPVPATNISFSTVSNIDQPPVFTPIADQTVNENDTLEFTAQAIDPDGQTVTYSLIGQIPEGATINSTTGAFRWATSYNQAGIDTIAIMAASGSKRLSTKNKAVLTDTLLVKVTVIDTDQPIIVRNINPAAGAVNVMENDTNQFKISAYDPDGNTLIYSWLLNGEPVIGDSIYSLITDYNSAGIDTLALTLSDAVKNKKRIKRNALNYEWIITIANVDRPPVIATVPDKTVLENRVLDFNVIANDPDGETVSYSALNAPLGSFINSSSGRFIWTPSYQQAGTYQFKVVASAGSKRLSKSLTKAILADTADVKITVQEANAAPVWAILPDTTFAEDATVIIPLNNYLSDTDDAVSSLKIGAEVSLWRAADTKKMSKLVLQKSSSRQKNGKNSQSWRYGATELSVTIDSLTHFATFTTTYDSTANAFFKVSFTATDDSSSSIASMKATVNPVNDAPMTFELLSPDSATTVVGKTINFKWTRSADVDNPVDSLKYLLNIYASNHNATADSILDSKVIAKDTTLTYDGSLILKNAKTYKWSVFVTDGTDTTECSNDLRPFSIKSWNISAFNLLSPSNNATNISNRPAFSWSSADSLESKGTYYKLKIYKVIGTTDSLHKIISTTSSSYTLSENQKLANGQSYRWTVTAFVGTDTLNTADGNWIFSVENGFKTTEDLESPNVLRPDINGMLEIVFKADASFTGIKIFTTQGRLIKELSKSGDRYTWDGKDKNGNKVGPGVYLYQIYSNGSVKRNGFVGVIR